MVSSPIVSEQLLEALDRLLHGLEVGEHPAEPAVVHVVLPGARGLELHRRLRLALGADEQQLAAASGRLAHEIERRPEARQRLVEIEDVDAVALAEQERLHARVPASGLMPEVDARLDQVADVDLGLLEGDGGRGYRRGCGCRGIGHEQFSFAVVRPNRIGTPQPAPAVAEREHRRGDPERVKLPRVSRLGRT